MSGSALRQFLKLCTETFTRRVLSRGIDGCRMSNIEQSFQYYFREGAHDEQRKINTI